jgi:hypothetical protein
MFRHWKSYVRLVRSNHSDENVGCVRSQIVWYAQALAILTSEIYDTQLNRFLKAGSTSRQVVPNAQHGAALQSNLDDRIDEVFPLDEFKRGPK